MGRAIAANLGKLEKYKNKKGFIEIMVRQKDSKFKEIIKVFPEELVGNDGNAEVVSELMKLGEKTSRSLADVRKEMNCVTKGVGELTSITKDMAANVDSIFSMTNSVKALSYLNVGLSMANIAVDVAGFAMIAVKLNSLSKEVQALDAKIDRISAGNKNEKKGRFRSLIFDYNSMCDCIRYNKEVDINKLEVLVKEYNTFITEMIDNLIDRVYDKEMLLQIINILMSPYTILLCEYLDRYYFENQAVPTNYDMYTSVYDELINTNFKQILEDYYFIEKGMHNIDVQDIVNAQMLLCLNGKVQVEDQIEILKELKTKEAVEEFKSDIAEVARQEAENMIPEIAQILNVNEEKCREALLLGA